MERKILAYMTIIGILIAVLLTGCAVGGYGKIRLQGRNSPAVTIGDLEESWRDYRIYYAELSVGNPAAIMFDPKNDNRTLVGDKWIKVEDKETVSKLIGWIQTERQFIPRLWRILWPDNQFYGYLFYALNDAAIKVVDDTTLYV